MQTHLPWKWEDVDGSTQRARVIGGWLIRSFFGDTQAMVWVKDNDHEWKIVEPKVDQVVERSTLAEEFA